MIIGQLAKIKILAYKSASFDPLDQLPDVAFNFLINPSNYSVDYNVNYDDAQALGTDSRDPAYIKSPPRTMNLEFLFDATNAIQGANPLINERVTENAIVEEIQDAVLTRLTLTTQIKLFEAVVFNVAGEQHAPNYLQILWGTLIFRCRLTSMQVNYKLFSPEGIPIRATINASFMEVKKQEDAVAERNDTSPDVTHQRTVKDGDKLPNMVRNIYDDHRYYISVAQANKLIQFRNLRPGRKIFFPPIVNSTP